jgi:adenosylcobyric acid synthase
MIQGASSSAGKSLLATALARAVRRRGIDVAPFKAQNMSNNARVVEGGEIGVAQYLQALAAGVEPDIRMNPVLIKPEGDTQSQVVVLGRVDAELSGLSWRARHEALWLPAERSLAELLSQHELVLLEGAGSPAEINLTDTDLANMRSAEAASATVTIVVDIDRGGAFAHLYGTWALLPNQDRRRVRGFVLNKFRGDPQLLPPGPERLRELTGVPTVGILPWLDHGLPDEDGAATQPRRGGRPQVGVVRYPTASNLDELKALEEVADVSWITDPGALDGADLVILPGSKNVASDMAWLERSGIAAATRSRAERGKRVLGICGGLQMLGESLADEDGVARPGIGLLSLATSFRACKTTRRTRSSFATLAGAWSPLSGLAAAGYEIHQGESSPTGPIEEVLPNELGYARGSVCGVYLHGLLEDPDIVAAVLGRQPQRSLEHVFDALGDAAEEHLDVSAMLREAGIA